LLLVIQPFHNIDFANSWAWEIFPSSVVFNFFLHWIVLFLLVVFHIFC
jgi:hypothetical protein